MTKLKSLYIGYRYTSVLLAFIATAIMSYLVSNIYFYDLAYKAYEYQLALLALLVIFLYYIFTNYIFLRNLKKDKISMILKRYEL